MDEYVSALAVEAAIYQKQKIETIYLGGGTPTMLASAQLIKLFAVIKENFCYSTNCEITVEANPENLDLEKAKALFDLGINRISLGVQTLDNDRLRYLGRAHDSFKALSAFNDLRRAGFKNINVDLMYSFPEQTSADIELDVKTVLGLGSEHVSIYTLTVEENSKFFVQKIKEQDNHAQGDQYAMVTSLLDEAGMRQYEVSNFSRPGFESRHNINYWTNGNYIGLGMSSHGHCDGRRSWNVSRLSDYLKKIAAGESPEEGHESLTPQARLRESLIFGLRMNVGIVVSEIEEQAHCQMSDELKLQIVDLVGQDLLQQQGQRLQTTARGRLVLDAIAVKLI